MRRPVRPGRRATEKVAKILFEVLRILLSRLSVDAYGTVLAGAPIRFEEQVEVDVVGQRRECRLRHLPRQLRYPLQFR